MVTQTQLETDRKISDSAKDVLLFSPQVDVSYMEAMIERKNILLSRYDKKEILLPADTKKCRAHRRSISESKAKILGDHTKEQWLLLLSICGDACPCCGTKCDSYTKDHIIPISLGGSNHISNIQPMCRECNSTDRLNHKDYRPKFVREIFHDR